MTTRSLGVAGLLVLSVVSCAVYSKKQPVESDKAVAMAYVKAWNQHDSVAIDTLLTRDGVHEDVAQNFRGKGSAAVVQFMHGLRASQPDFKWTVTNTLEDGQTVVLEWTWTGTYTGRDPTGKQVSGRRVSGKGVSIAELDNGKIKRFTDYYDDASFFR
jgi:steroid delta-isomerase-like uncharacterized protein